MHYTTFLLAALSLTLTSAAVIPSNGVIPPNGVPGGIPPPTLRKTNVAPATANFGTSVLLPPPSLLPPQQLLIILCHT